MAKSAVSYPKLMKLAEECSVNTNPLFISAAKSAAEEMKILERMQNQIDEDGLIVSKEYVKGRQNIVAHPLIAEMPKHRTCLNQTLQTMMAIIVEMGAKKEPEDGMDLFLKGHQAK